MTPSQNDANFTHDALGRIRTRATGVTGSPTSTDTYSYVGTGATVARISNSVGPTTTDSIVDALEAAYDDFEARIAARRSLSSLTKQQQVREYVLHHAAEVFRTREVRAALPGVSDQTIKLVLGQMRREGAIEPEAGASGPRSARRRGSP